MALDVYCHRHAGYVGWKGFDMNGQGRYPAAETLRSYPQPVYFFQELLLQPGYFRVGVVLSNGAQEGLFGQEGCLFDGAAYANPRQRAVSRLPEITFSAGASWRITRYLHWDTDCQYVASQYAHSMRSPNPMLVKVDDFFILNTRLSLDLQALSRLHGELTLAIENVLDKNYSYFPGYPMPGAMAYAGVKVKFW